MLGMRKKVKVLGGVILVFLFSGLLFAWHHGKKVEVEVVEVTRGPLRSIVEATGTVRAVNQNVVVSEISAKVKKVWVKEGDRVKEGQVLLEFDDSELRRQLERAKAAVKFFQAQLEQIQAGARQEEVTQARALVSQAEAAYEQSRQQLVRLRQLFEQQAVSRQQLEEAETNFKIAQEELIRARAQLNLLQEGAQQEALEAAAAQLEQAKAELALLQLNLSRARVLSPISGTVLKKMVTVGTFVPVGTELFVIGDPSRLEILALIHQEDMAGIQVGERVEIEFDSGPERRKIEGWVKKISPAAETQVSSLGLRQAVVPVTVGVNETEGLLPGYRVELNFITADREDVLLVPEDALFEENQNHKVLVVEEGIAQSRLVKIGGTDGNLVEVISGLKEGELVVLDPEKVPAERVSVRVDRKIRL